jgi:three-Cys-motif partner protein
LEKLTKTNALEVIINFPVGMAIQRLLPRSGKFSEEQRAKLTQYFGSAEWEPLLYHASTDLFGEASLNKVSDSGDRLAKWYRDRLKELFGFATLPRLITNRQGGHLYYLIHAGPNQTGVKIANDVLMKSTKAIR